MHIFIMEKMKKKFDFYYFMISYKRLVETPYGVIVPRLVATGRCHPLFYYPKESRLPLGDLLVNLNLSHLGVRTDEYFE